MKYPDQNKTIARLEKETLTAHRADEEKAVNRLAVLWAVVKKDLKRAINEQYRSRFPGGTWDLTTARATGTLIRMEHHIHAILDTFSIAAMPFIEDTLLRTKKETKLRAAWMMDMTTPPKVKPILNGYKVKQREAQAISGMAQLYTGKEAQVFMTERWGAWLRAYSGALNTNIQLGALNASSPEDAAAEVDTARPGSPANDFWDILDRLFRTEIIGAQADGMDEFLDSNAENLMTEVWVAHADSRVCEDCVANDGKTADEVGGDEIPMHPYCRCFWRMVPKAWNDLMKQTDPEGAAALDKLGIPPTGMAVRDPATGKVEGFTTVDFYDWKGNLVMSY